MTADRAIDEQVLLEIAVECARAAAAELMSRYGSVSATASKSSPTDLVSEADVAAEKAIRRLLAQHRPGDAILGEEGGATEGDSATGLRWVVDPLDGTTDYLYGLPQFAVSVACEDADGALAGAVLDPVRDELFTAVRSGSPTCNGTLITPRLTAPLGEALVATGFGYAAAVRAEQAVVLGRILPAVRDIRRLGAAALDLCWVAAGRFDAYFERGLKPWDRAAGELIAERAGLDVRELAEDGPTRPGGVLVAPSGIVEQLLGLVLGEPSA